MTMLQTRRASHQWLEAAKTAGCGLAFALGLHTFVAQVRYIPSESMVPTLQVGDRLIVEKLSYHFHAPQRGDIVVFKAPPELGHRDLIKRIVGVPGDVIAVRNGRLYLNGQVQQEAYVQASARYSYGPVRVPVDRFFVLGDNRNHSYDSHFWGFLPRRDIVGHAVVRFYPLPHFSLL